VTSDFDTRAGTWDDDPAKVYRAAAIATAIHEWVPLGGTTRLLEYGAGTGLVGQHLAAHIGPLALADPSAGMREVAARKVASGLFPAGTQVLDLDLSRAPAPADTEADVVVTAMTLHHIPDLAPVLRGLAELLVDGGALCIADLEREDGSFHDHDPDFDGHDGFEREGLTAQLEAAGFEDVRFTRCYELEKAGRTYPIFLATATRRHRHDSVASFSQHTGTS
jgi:SAM-dependent methyltransferase